MSSAAPGVDIRPDHWAIVDGLLRQHVPDRKVLVFGSRATWTAKYYSDLDLAILGDEPLSADAKSALAEGFGESDLPFKVDLVDWARIDEFFRDIIRRDGVVVQIPGMRSVAADPVRRSLPESRNLRAQGEWTSITLGRVCTKIGSGATPRGGRDVYMSSGPYALIRSQNVFNDGFYHNGLAYIGERHASELAGVEVQARDVLLNITGGSVARACMVDSRVLPARVNQHVAIIRPDPDKLDPGFLRYFLISPNTQARLLSWAGGGGTGNGLTKGMIETFDVPAPRDVGEQRAISDILGTVDHKIELNGRMNPTLEAMARALFKSWFVDFEPVRAKMEGRDTGLPKDIADLFPDRLVESELGEIPEGWPLVRLPELIDVNPQRPLRRGEIAPYLDMANMPTRGHAPNSVIQRPFKSGMRFANGDTLVARITPCLENGKTAYVDFLGDDEVGWGSTEYIVLKPRHPLPSEFAYTLARTARFREFAVQNMSGTSGRLRVPATALSGFSIPSPPAAVGAEFGRVAQLLLGRARAALDECRVLANCRDTLLPQLVSGELRVTDLAPAFSHDDRATSTGTHEA